MSRKSVNCAGCKYFVAVYSRVYHGIVQGCSRQEWDGLPEDMRSGPLKCYEATDDGPSLK